MSWSFDFQVSPGTRYHLGSPEQRVRSDWCCPRVREFRIRPGRLSARGQKKASGARPKAPHEAHRVSTQAHPILYDLATPPSRPIWVMSGSQSDGHVALGTHFDRSVMVSDGQKDRVFQGSAWKPALAMKPPGPGLAGRECSKAMSSRASPGPSGLRWAAESGGAPALGLWPASPSSATCARSPSFRGASGTELAQKRDRYRQAPCPSAPSQRRP